MSNKMLNNNSQQNFIKTYIVTKSNFKIYIETLKTLKTIIRPYMPNKNKRKNKNHSRSNTKKHHSSSKSETNYQNEDSNSQEHQIKPEVQEGTLECSGHVKEEHNALNIEYSQVKVALKFGQLQQQNQAKESLNNNILHNESEVNEQKFQLPILHPDQSVIAITVPDDDQHLALLVQENHQNEPCELSVSQQVTPVNSSYLQQKKQNNQTNQVADIQEEENQLQQKLSDKLQAQQNEDRKIEINTPSGCDDQGAAQVDGAQLPEHVDNELYLGQDNCLVQVQNVQFTNQTQLQPKFKLQSENDFDTLNKPSNEMEQQKPHIDEKYDIGQNYDQQKQTMNPLNSETLYEQSLFNSQQQERQEQHFQPKDQQAWLSKSKKLSYPVISTPQPQSELDCSTTTPIKVEQSGPAHSKQQKQAPAESFQTHQMQHQEQRSLSVEEEFPQLIQVENLSQKNPSFIDMLRESQLQAQSHSYLETQPNQNSCQIKSSSITHQLISSSSLQTPSPQPSIVKFIVFDNPPEHQPQKQSQNQQHIKPCHLVHDQNQQQLANQQSLNCTNQHQQETNHKQHQLDEKIIQQTKIQSELERIKNDIEMTQKQSIYDLEQVFEVSVKDKVELVSQEEMDEHQKVEELKSFIKKQQKLDQKTQPPLQKQNPVENTPIQLPTHDSKSQESFICTFHLQSSPSPKRHQQAIGLPSPCLQSPTVSELSSEVPTKVEQIKRFFEQNSKIVEEIEMEDDLGDAKDSESEQIDHKQEIFRFERADVGTNIGLERGEREHKQEQKSEGQQSETNQKELIDSADYNHNGQPSNQNQHQQMLPSFDPISSLELIKANDQFPLVNQTDPIPFHSFPEHSQHPLSTSQPNLSDYEMNQHSLASQITQSPQKESQQITEQHQLHVSREHYQEGEAEQESERKEESSPILYKVKANQILFNNNGRQENAHKNTRAQFQLHLAHVHNVGHREVHSRREPDDLHNPTNSPVQISEQSDESTPILENMNENWQINQTTKIHQNLQQSSIVIHHLEGRPQQSQMNTTSQLSNDLFNQHIIQSQTTSFHPHLIHHLHGRIPHNTASIQTEHNPKSSIQEIFSESAIIQQETQDSQILNKLQEVVSEHMITEEDIQLPSDSGSVGQLGVEKESGTGVNERGNGCVDTEVWQSLGMEQEGSQSNQMPQSVHDNEWVMREFRNRQKQFFKKIIPQPLYVQHSQFNQASQNQHLHQQLPDTPAFTTQTNRYQPSHPPIYHPQPIPTKQNTPPYYPLNQPIQTTPNRQPQNQRIVHSVVRKWSGNCNLIVSNQVGMDSEWQRNGQHTFESPERIERIGNEQPTRYEIHDDEKPSANNQWKPSHRDTIIDALNDLDEEPKHIQYQPINQPSSFILPHSQSSSFNPTILESFTPINIQQASPLGRTQTQEFIMGDTRCMTKENTASMPFLNSRPSDRYRQFIDDDSAQKKVEESRNFDGLGTIVGVGGSQQANINTVKHNDTKLTVQTIPLQSPPINHQAIKPNIQQSNLQPTITTQPNPSTQPVVFTMQEYKKRYSAYSFVKPKTNIISLESIQRQAYTGGERNQYRQTQLTVQVQRRSQVTSQVRRQEIEKKELVSGQTNGQQTKYQRKGDELNREYQVAAKNNTHAVLEQNSETSISPPTVAARFPSQFQRTNYASVMAYHQQSNTTPDYLHTVSSNESSFAFNEIRSTIGVQQPLANDKQLPAVKIVYQDSITLAESSYVPLRNSHQPRQESIDRQQVIQQVKILMDEQEKLQTHKDTVRIEHQAGLAVNEDKTQIDIIVANTQTEQQPAIKHSGMINEIEQHPIQTQNKRGKQQDERFAEILKIATYPPVQTPVHQQDSTFYPASYHQQFFTSYSQAVPESHSYHGSGNFIFTSHLAKDQVYSPLQKHIYPNSAPIVSLPQRLTTQLQPIYDTTNHQETQINELNICSDKLSRSGDRSREKKRVILKLPQPSPTPTNKSSRHEGSIQKNHQGQTKNNFRGSDSGQYKNHNINQNDNNYNQYQYGKIVREENVRPISFFYTDYSREMSENYANYDKHNGRELYYSSTPKTNHLKKQILSNKSPSNYPHPQSSITQISPSKLKQVYQTGPRGNTNSGSKPKPSHQPVSPSYNTANTPFYTNNKLSEPLCSQYSMTNPIANQQKLSESLEREFMRSNESQEKKRTRSKGKKQKICLTLRRDYIKKPNKQDEQRQAEDQYSRAKPKLKQVKLARDTLQDQFSPHLIRKEYKQKKFMKIQKFYANETQSSRHFINNRHQPEKVPLDNNEGSPENTQLPNDTLNFTKLFSFLDRPQPVNVQETTEKFSFITQQRSEQLSSKPIRNYIYTVNHQQNEGQPKTKTPKLLSIGRKPQFVLKTEHYNRKNPARSEYERADRTRYKLVEHEAGETDEFKGFVRSKLARENNFKKSQGMQQDRQKSESLSDVENQDLPMMSR